MENTLVCTIGLPRSGKSTWARKQDGVIVNPDSVRLALHGQRFQILAEPFVWAIAQVMVRALFLAGNKKVIVDATNTTEERRKMWISDKWDTEWIYINTPAEVCKARAQQSDMSDLIPVIDHMEFHLTVPKSDLKVLL